MAKRFSDTGIWEEDWFLEMPNECKLFWFYMLAKCDHAGVFKVNLRSFRGLIEGKLTSTEALEYFNKGKNRIRVLSDNVWFIEDFFVYQYGTTFNINNRLHEGVKNALQKQKIDLTSIRGLIDLKDGVKEKDKEKEIKKGGVGENKEIFVNGVLHKPERINGHIVYPRIKGIKFNDEKTRVWLMTEEWQELGLTQIKRVKSEGMLPGEIYKGYIN